MKLRISDHKLNIETGRYNKISRCDRICPVCSLDNEDEIHFLLDCAKYSSIRDDFFNKIANRIPNYKHIPISTLIIQLMNSTDYYLNKQLVQYATSCLEMRDIPLTNRVREPYRKLRTVFFPPRFMAQVRSARAINRRGKTRIRNLQYGPRKRR